MRATYPPGRWQRERPEYYVQTGSMFENPYGVPVDEILAFVVENPAEISAQVVFGKYVESSGLVFTGELIQQLIDRSQQRIMTGRWTRPGAEREARRWYEERGDWGPRYATGVDFGRQTDFTVLMVIDTRYEPAELVYYRRLNRVPWETIYREVGRAVHRFGPSVLCDSTGPAGDVVMDALHNRVYCARHDRTYLSDSACPKQGEQGICDEDDYVLLGCCDGYAFSSTTKVQLVEHLRNVMAVGYDSATPDVPFGLLRVPPIVQLEEELSFYAWDDKRLETDCLMALALACWLGLEGLPSETLVGGHYG